MSNPRTTTTPSKRSTAPKGRRPSPIRTRASATCSSCGYANSMGLVMGHTILDMDEPEHGQYRRLIQQAFTRKEMDRWEHEIARPILDRFISAFAGRGSVGLVRE